MEKKHTNNRIAPWKCEVGDIVDFHFSQWALKNGSPSIRGVITGRDEKFVMVTIKATGVMVRLHVSMINIIQPVMTEGRMKKALSKKFHLVSRTQKESSNREHITTDIGGLKFSYNKKLKSQNNKKVGLLTKKAVQL